MAKKKIQHHAAAGGKAIGKGLLAGAGFLAKRASLGGGAARYVEDYAADHIEMVRTKIYGGPLVILAGAALVGGVGKLMKANPDAAKGIAGAAGYSLAMNYKLKQFQDGKAPSPFANRDFSEKGNSPGAANASTPAAGVAPGAQGYADEAMFN